MASLAKLPTSGGGLHHALVSLTAPSWSLHWAQFWGSSGFSHNQNNRGSSSACVTCMYCGMSDVSMKTHVKRCASHEDREHICFAFAFACVVGKNLKTPKLSPMADNAITQGGIIGNLVSLVYMYICGLFILWKYVFQVQLLLTCLDGFILQRKTSSVMHRSSRFTPTGCVFFPVPRVQSSLQVIEEDSNKQTRWIREAIWIRKQGPNVLNRDEGVYSLSLMCMTSCCKELWTLGMGKKYASCGSKTTGSAHYWRSLPSEAFFPKTWKSYFFRLLTHFAWSHDIYCFCWV